MNQLICAVTGASGYIGKQIVATLRDKNYFTYELGRSKKQGPHFLYYSFNEIQFPNLNNVDVLIHCAYDFSANTLEKSIKINLDGSMRLFQHAIDSGVKKIIVISSMSAFLGTKSIYGKTKLALEAQATALGAIIVRPGLVFGENTQGIVGAMKKFVRKFPVVPLIGRGAQRFHPCHVSDLCELIILLINTNIISTKPIIAATKKFITFRQMVALLAIAENKKALLIPVPYALIFTGLKLLEKLNINIGLRSDSLIGAQFYDRDPDFSALEALTDMHFREMNLTTGHQKRTAVALAHTLKE
ncbi:MAG: NAD-dependent epimerase/dehydratase family protein [Gammaproteobacteria bacterium]|nr:NAD-dependent epimerase/dehydratase family protein [Gammaproteobacteria bacterium]